NCRRGTAALGRDLDCAGQAQAGTYICLRRRGTMFEDSLNGIATFLTAVEAGSFAAAATRIHVTRSAVAKSIARLEGRLGVRLFHRTTRQQTLTDEGVRYYEHCSRLMADLRDVESALHDGKQGLEGRVRVS